MKTTVQISIETREGVYNISAEELGKLLGLRKREAINAVKVTLSQGNKSLFAIAEPDEEYPAITVDGEADEKKFFLANIELPNPMYPNDFTSRLYAGCANYETDGPIAIVKSRIDGKKPSGKAYVDGDILTKIVYVDTDEAQYRPWKGDLTQLPEHVED